MNKRVCIFSAVFVLALVGLGLFIKLHYLQDGTPLVFEIQPGQTAGKRFFRSANPPRKGHYQKRDLV